MDGMEEWEGLSCVVNKYPIFGLFAYYTEGEKGQKIVDVMYIWKHP